MVRVRGLVGGAKVMSVCIVGSSSQGGGRWDTCPGSGRGLGKAG